MRFNLVSLQCHLWPCTEGCAARSAVISVAVPSADQRSSNLSSNTIEERYFDDPVAWWASNRLRRKVCDFDSRCGTKCLHDVHILVPELVDVVA